MPETADQAPVYGSENFECQVKEAFGPAFLKVMDAIGRRDMYGVTDIEAVRLLGERMELGHDSQILELCCGIGGPARWLAQTYGCSATGVDLSDYSVNVARARTRERGLDDRVNFKQGDALEPPVALGAYSHVYGVDSWVYLPNKADLYQVCRDVLAPGGTLAFVDLAVKEPKTVTWWWEEYFGHHHPETRQAYRQFLEQAKFHNVRIEGVHSYATTSLMRAIHRMIGLRDTLKPELGELYRTFVEFAAAVLAEYEAGNLDHILVVAGRD